MDASDAAEYVQELAGEDANIIFGAMYDDSRADEAIIDGGVIVEEGRPLDVFEHTKEERTKAFLSQVL